MEEYNGFIEVPLEQDLERILERKVLFDNCKMDPRRRYNARSNWIGAAGEIAFESLYPEALHHNKHDYDYLLYGKKAEIKTKERKEPDPPTNPDHEAGIDTRQDQEYDVVVFVRYNDRTKGEKKEAIAWAIGWVTKAEFLKYRYRQRKGDPIANNEHLLAKFESWQIAFKHLHPMGELENFCKNGVCND